MKTLYITDLDGTLLDADSRVSARTAAILNEAIGRGALFSIATARTPATVSEIMRPIHLELPLIVMTGAALWNMKTGLYSEVQHMKPATARQVVETYRRHDCAAFLYTLPPAVHEGLGTRRMLIYHFGALNAYERTFMEERLTNPFKHFEVPESGDSLLPAEIRDTVLFFGIQPSDIAKKVFEDLKGIPEINPMYYHDWFGDDIAEIEAFPEGATKAKAVRRLAAKVGAERVVVFGDNRNDISMMQAADVAIAVDNARDEVKAVAHITIGENTADSVARFILEDFKNHS